MTQVIQSHFMLGVMEAAERQGVTLSTAELRQLAQKLIDERAHGFTAYHASTTDAVAIAEDVRAVLATMKPKDQGKPATPATYGVAADVWAGMTARQRLDVQRRYEAAHGQPKPPRINGQTEATLLAERHGLALLAAGVSGPRREAALKGLAAVDKKLADLKR